MRPSNLCTLTPFALLLTAAGCVAQGPGEPGEAAESERANEIVGGAAAQITTFPWQVSLQSAQGAHFCGGSILTATWIVTAAHCVAEGAPGRIVAGISKLSQSATGQTRLIKRVISYPGYTDTTVGKDAALIELTAPLDLNGTTVRAVAPVTAADAASVTNPGVMATVSGWGTLSEGATTLPDQLQSVQVPIVALSDASTDYGMALTADQLAAGLRGVGGRDSCQGDSGGPLVVSRGGEMVLAGIVSWGNGCARANAPGLYARVTSFAKWMDGYVGGPPVAAAGEDLSVKPGDRVQLDASASKDAGFGTIASYRWRQVSGATVALEGDSAKVVSFVAPSAEGQLELELTVTDDQGTAATDRVLVVLSKKATGGTPGMPGKPGSSDDSTEEITGGCSAQPGGAGGAAMMLALLAMLAPRARRARRSRR